MIEPVNEKTLNACHDIWNEVVLEGNAFPQDQTMDLKEAEDFFASQTFTGAAIDPECGEVVGMYILHPNNTGRCGHICNASYAVKSTCRNQQIGRQLVLDCIGKARKAGFRILQFNAVVASNLAALHLYKQLGFEQLGLIKEGFLNKDGVYEDIIVHVYDLMQDEKTR